MLISLLLFFFLESHKHWELSLSKTWSSKPTRCLKIMSFLSCVVVKLSTAVWIKLDWTFNATSIKTYFFCLQILWFIIWDFAYWDSYILLRLRKEWEYCICIIEVRRYVCSFSFNYWSSCPVRNPWSAIREWRLVLSVSDSSFIVCWSVRFVFIFLWQEGDKLDLSWFLLFFLFVFEIFLYNLNKLLSLRLLYLNLLSLFFSQLFSFFIDFFGLFNDFIKSIRLSYVEINAVFRI